MPVTFLQNRVKKFFLLPCKLPSDPGALTGVLPLVWIIVAFCLAYI